VNRFYEKKEESNSSALLRSSLFIISFIFVSEVVSIILRLTPVIMQCTPLDSRISFASVAWKKSVKAPVSIVFSIF
jgi:hypothetical protein